MSPTKSPGFLHFYGQLLAESHSRFAIVQEDGEFNEIPLTLLTLYHLGIRDQALVRRTYHALAYTCSLWTLSPAPITNEDLYRGRHSYQRAFVDYFALTFLHNNFSKACIRHLLFGGERPLIYGLFPGRGLSMFGQPLVTLADSLDLFNQGAHHNTPGNNGLFVGSLLMSEALGQAATSWTGDLFELLSCPTTPSGAPAVSTLLSPEEVLDRVAFDGRFSGIMRAGPGFYRVDDVLKNPAVRGAVVGYLRRTELRLDDGSIADMAYLAASLLATTHVPGRVAFDYFLTQLPTYVWSARVLMTRLGPALSAGDRLALLRMLWCVVLLTYVTQLRPRRNADLLLAGDVAEEYRGWEEMFEEVRQQQAMGSGSVVFMRALVSLRRLDRVFRGLHGHLYLKAGWKLVKSWEGWTGLGQAGEVTMNVRL
ncbi:hypothetical protein VTJ49DRAFT_3421 [Mycothermus thermophilus]|uniref:Uncharacterized protein n=1 Tax=Humicola insolens TaxID=85995 RepID=A0ABR3V7Q9_HUMIN